MKTNRRNIVIFLTIIAIVIGVAVFLYNNVKRSDVNETEEAADKVTEKHSKEKDTRDSDKGLVNEEAQKESKGVSISGEVEAGYEASGEKPDFDKGTVVLKNIENMTVIQSAECTLPGKFKFKNFGKGEYLVDAIRCGDWVVMPEYVEVTGEEDISDIYLAFTRTRDFTGIVFDPDGNPVEGAKVVVSESSGSVYSHEFFDELARTDRAKIMYTDKDGKFTSYSRIMCADIAASKDGFAPEMVHICTAQEQGDVPLILRLSAEAIVTGTVLDSSGNPCADVEIFAYYRGRKSLSKCPDCWLAKTDSTGRFELRELYSGNYELFIGNDDVEAGATVICKAVAKKTVDAGTIILKEVHTLEGILVDEQGKGIADAKIAFEKLGNLNKDELWHYNLGIRSIINRYDENVRVSTDSYGRFTLRYFDDVEFTIKAECDGYSSAEKTINTKEQKDIKLILKKIDYLTLTIKVIDEYSGEPLEGAWVNLRPDKSDLKLVNALSKDISIPQFYSRETDEKGEAILKVTFPGKWILSASNEGMSSDDVSVVLEKGYDQRIDIPLRKPPMAVVTIISKETEEPINDAVVVISPNYDFASSKYHSAIDRLDSDEFFTGKDGIASVPCYEEGSYKIKAWAFGYLKAEKEFLLNENSVILISLDEAATVKGKVVSKKGNPIPLAGVNAVAVKDKQIDADDSSDSINIIEDASSPFGENTGMLESDNPSHKKSEESDEINVNEAMYRSLNASMTNKDGIFKMQITKPGTYRIVAGHSDYASAQSEEIRIGEKDTIENLVIILGYCGSISGKVTDQDGNALPDIRISYTEDSSPSNEVGFFGEALLTNESSKYFITSLIPGKYTVLVQNVEPDTGFSSPFMNKEGASGLTTGSETAEKDNKEPVATPEILKHENIIVEEGVETKNIDFVVKKDNAEE